MYFQNVYLKKFLDEKKQLCPQENIKDYVSQEIFTLNTFKTHIIYHGIQHSNANNIGQKTTIY